MTEATHFQDRPRDTGEAPKAHEGGALGPCQSLQASTPSTHAPTTLEDH